jgi:hypothetical protein
VKLANNAPGTTAVFQVTTADSQTHEIQACEVHTEGGALVLLDRVRKLEVAFGPGAWLEVQPK